MTDWLRTRLFPGREVIELRKIVAEQQELIDAYHGRTTALWKGRCPNCKQLIRTGLTGEPR